MRRSAPSTVDLGSSGRAGIAHRDNSMGSGANGTVGAARGGPIQSAKRADAAIVFTDRGKSRAGSLGATRLTSRSPRLDAREDEVESELEVDALYVRLPFRVDAPEHGDGIRRLPVEERAHR